MKVFLLAGGFGSRISEHSHLKPKPMIEIGGKPILWHIMKIYSQSGLTDFVILGGYKAYIIKEYFANYFLHNSDVTFDLKTNKMTVHQNFSEPWSVTILDTGLNTMTGGRIKKAMEHVGDDEKFCLTYGDGVANINIKELLAFHEHSNTLATLTAVKPPGRFGQLDISHSKVEAFVEKPEGDGAYINGGFFVLSKEIFNYIEDDSTIWEREPLEKLAAKNQLSAYVHDGFWQPMDTLRDRMHLEELWESGEAPWKVW